MTIGCNGICAKYKSKRKGTHLRYANGEKRCQRCAIFIDWDGIRCPCCSYKLRTRPHFKNTKKSEKSS
ncbi:MAG: hypothetical protein OEL84_01715 [Nitrosopumilus sp.]|nr:hypothetical protein [Nitrosopumilus sp.]